MSSTQQHNTASTAAVPPAGPASNGAAGGIGTLSLDSQLAVDELRQIRISLDQAKAHNRVRALQWAISHYWDCRGSHRRTHHGFEYCKFIEASGDLTEHHSDDLLPALLHAFMAGGDYVACGLSHAVYYFSPEEAADKARVAAAAKEFSEKLKKCVWSLIGEEPVVERLQEAGGQWANGRYRLHLK